MTTIYDVAQYILEQAGEMPAMKLQKLSYYSQAWSLVWEDTPLFPERFEAWPNGPVSPVLYEKHRGKFKVDAGMQFGNSGQLTQTQRETIDRVLDAMKDKTGLWFISAIQSEAPWVEARGGASPIERCNTEITLESMYEYYASL